MVFQSGKCLLPNGDMLTQTLPTTPCSVPLTQGRVRLSVTPRPAARQASLSIPNSQSSLKLTSIESEMPSSHLILCRALLLLPPIPPSIRVFSKESVLLIRWPKYYICLYVCVYIYNTRSHKHTERLVPRPHEWSLSDTKHRTALLHQL